MSRLTPPTLPPFGEDLPDPGNDAPDEAELWFLPGPEEDPAPGFWPGPGIGPAANHPADPSGETALLEGWAEAEAAHAGLLARAAFRLGALDERLRRAPEGWRQRLALLEAAEISWFAGDRVPLDRLGLWLSLRLSGVQEDAQALARAGWAMRRLSGGPGPLAAPGLASFLGRRDLPGEAAPEALEGRTGPWEAMIAAAGALHPLTRAGFGYRLWPLAGISPGGDRLEAAVVAARLAASECRGGAVFVPLARGGAEALRQAGTPQERLGSWLRGAEAAMIGAMRHLEELEAWAARAEAACAGLSGRTPARLIAALSEWPMLSAPMAEVLTGASRAAVQRNLLWFEAAGLIRELTGQGRFRLFQAAL